MEPDTEFLGIEPNHAGLIAPSRQVGRGAANIHFALGSLEELPGPFAGLANSLTVLFPWGSLLRAVACAEPDRLRALFETCAPGAAIEVVTALDPAADAGELSRLGIEAFSPERMADGWRAAGFADVCVAALTADHPYQTTWWKKIRQRQGRAPLLLRAKRP